MEQDSVKIPEVKRAELNAILKQQVESLRMIEEKTSFEKFMEAKMKKKTEAEKSAEEKKEEQAKTETAELADLFMQTEAKKDEEEPPKITELIMREATQL